ncbi:hypothetical protein [Bradyrhizobium prioriisuperbiae]|uniref:hypothetical protein n=1 Tax=Bradyrhizobium prioriisuperbiae TaxID=2854389 RepID=UPI0028E3A90E|nr:hypothetical protein [Bradyrhizobium prioritasuperba]
MTLLMSVSGRRARPGKRRSHVVPALLSGVIGAAAVSAVCYLLWPTWTPQAVSDPSRLPISVGGMVFNVPTESMRMKVQRHTGPQERVDLSFAYPSLAAGEPRKRISAETVEDTEPSIDAIFLSIAAHGEALAPDERTRTIYPRYLAAGAARTDDGLTAQAFRDNTPYANEDLFVAASPSLVARCTRDGETPGMCLSERRLDGADLTFRFPRGWLADWRAIAGAMDRIVAQIYKPQS